MFNLASAGAIGTLVLAIYVLPPGGPAREAAMRLAGWSAVAWAAGATVHTAATFLFIANRPASAGFGEALLAFLMTVDAGRAGALTAAIAAAVALGCFRLRSPRLAALTLLVAFAGLVPLVLKSHAAGGADHADSTTAVVIHAAAASVWLGGLLALVVLRPAVPGRQLDVTVRRYSTLALVSFIALAVSGFLAAWTQVTSIEALMSPYGVILLAKAAAFIVLGILGALHRRWSLTRLDRDPGPAGRHFAALAVAELAVMGAASGMAAALARTEPPAALAAADSDAVLPAPGVWEYVSRWAPDPLWSLACGFAVFFFVAGVRRLRAEGIAWPAHRTALWLAGVAVLFTVTNGGVHIYQGYLFNAHVLTQMILTAVVPLLLVPAAPLSLARLAVKSRSDGSTGAGEFLQGAIRPVLGVLRRDPLIGIFILAACLFATYFSPLLEWSAGGQIGYSTLTLFALLGGCLATAALTGTVDPGSGSVLRGRLQVVAATAALYAFWGWKLTDTALEVERPWYTSVGQPWGSIPAVAPELGGTLMWSLAAINVIVTAAMVLTSRAPVSRARNPEGMPIEDDAPAAASAGPESLPVPSGSPTEG